MPSSARGATPEMAYGIVTPLTVAGVSWLQPIVPATCVPCESIASAVNPRLGVLLLNTLAAMTLLLVNLGSPNRVCAPYPVSLKQGCATSMPESTTATFTPSPALAAPPALFHASIALMIDRSGSVIIG